MFHVEHLRGDTSTAQAVRLTTLENESYSCALAPSMKLVDSVYIV